MATFFFPLWMKLLAIFSRLLESVANLSAFSVFVFFSCVSNLFVFDTISSLLDHSLFYNCNTQTIQITENVISPRGAERKTKTNRKKHILLLLNNKQTNACKNSSACMNAEYEDEREKSKPVWRVDRHATLERQKLFFFCCCFIFVTSCFAFELDYQRMPCLVWWDREKPFRCPPLAMSFWELPWILPQRCYCFGCDYFLSLLQCIRSRTICLRVKRKTSCKLGE